MTKYDIQHELSQVSEDREMEILLLIALLKDKRGDSDTYQAPFRVFQRPTSFVPRRAKRSVQGKRKRKSNKKEKA
jgi:predicted DNA-binding ribbon-helix-helix protein